MFPPVSDPLELTPVLVSDLIRSALRTIGKLGPGRTPSTSEYTDALTTLNSLVSSWCAENLMCYAARVDALPVVAGQGAYTLGQGMNFLGDAPPADWPIPRPNDFYAAQFEGVPLDILTDLEWSAVPNKTDSGTPAAVWFDWGYPLVTVNLWRVPTIDGTLELSSKSPLTGFSAVTDTMALPRGYFEALKTNLSVALAPEWGGNLTADIVQRARETKGQLKIRNWRPAKLRVDDALLDTRVR